MNRNEPVGRLLARCVVCCGNIHVGDAHEMWEGGYYCSRHSLAHLRDRARAYAELLRSSMIEK